MTDWPADAIAALDAALAKVQAAADESGQSRLSGFEGRVMFEAAKAFRDTVSDPVPTPDLGKARYLTTEPITIPAGTELTPSGMFGGGGLEAMFERGLMRVFIGRAAGLAEGMIVARPILKAIP